MIDKVAYPTVGRIVLYHEPEKVEPWPAMVVEVYADRYTISILTVFLHDGVRTVNHVHHAAEVNSGEPYWDWMAYQKGQAAKTEQLQAELEKVQQAREQRDIDRANIQKGLEATRSPALEPGGPARALKLDKLAEQAKGVGRAADKSLPEHHQSPNYEERELSKMQASTPSREDGKR